MVLESGLLGSRFWACIAFQSEGNRNHNAIGEEMVIIPHMQWHHGGIDVKNIVGDQVTATHDWWVWRNYDYKDTSVAWLFLMATKVWKRLTGERQCIVILKADTVNPVSQSYPTLCDPMNRSLPGSSVHGILQARILEWLASHSLLQGIFPT